MNQPHEIEFICRTCGKRMVGIISATYHKEAKKGHEIEEYVPGDSK